MKATVLKRDRRYEVRNDRGYGIQSFGEGNDYPQRVLEIIAASGTGASCVDVYSKFISGKGFSDKLFYKKVVNRNGHTNDYILDQIRSDYAAQGGFALHVNYNAAFKVVELQYMPFETVRFEKLNDETNDFSRVAIHPDWGRRFLSLRKWKKDDIVFIDLFNPDPVAIQEQVTACGGWENYRGQVYYYSNQGEKTYPVPLSDTVLTDMSTEEGISNVSYRNARNNFLTAGLLADIVDDNDNVVDKAGSEDEEGKRHREDDTNETEKSLLSFQGDEEACKIMYVKVGSKDEIPVFVPFKGTNYDKEFSVTLKTAQENIGKRFNQPPILRAENVGANFGADLMKNAYDYYNSVTENERLIVERVFSTIFQHWFEASASDFSIMPLSYDVDTSIAERLGNSNLGQLTTILVSDKITREDKISISKTLFGLTQEEASNLLQIQQPIAP